MREKRRFAIGLFALLIILLLTLSLLSTHITYALSTTGVTSHYVTNASSTWKGMTTNWANRICTRMGCKRILFA